MLLICGTGNGMYMLEKGFGILNFVHNSKLRFYSMTKFTEADKRTVEDVLKSRSYLVQMSSLIDANDQILKNCLEEAIDKTSGALTDNTKEFLKVHHHDVLVKLKQERELHQVMYDSMPRNKEAEAFLNKLTEKMYEIDITSLVVEYVDKRNEKVKKTTGQYEKVQESCWAIP